MSKNDNLSTKPISMWGYFWLQVLFAVPFFGFIALICFALFSKNVNRRNFARSYFCAAILILIVLVVLYACGGLAAIIALLEGFTAGALL